MSFGTGVWLYYLTQKSDLNEKFRLWLFSQLKGNGLSSEIKEPGQEIEVPNKK
jgi:hypothetical protein